jgi:hypothetical protein
MIRWLIELKNASRHQYPDQGLSANNHQQKCEAGIGAGCLPAPHSIEITLVARNGGWGAKGSGPLTGSVVARLNPPTRIIARGSRLTRNQNF